MRKIKYLLLVAVGIVYTACDFSGMVVYINLYEGTVTSPITADGDYLYLGKRPSSNNNSQTTFINQVNLETGASVTVAGNNTASIVNGIGPAASFKDIEAILVSPFDTPTILYVGDECTVRKVDTQTWQVTIIAGASTSCSKLEGVGAAARFTNVKGLAHDGTFLYIATTGYIMRMDLGSGQVVTFAGDTGQVGHTNGVGTAASFDRISGITLLGQDLYVVDSGNFRIRKVDTLTAEVTTVAGSGLNQTKDGIGLGASFNFNGNNSITSDGSDVLFVSDNSAIRKIILPTYEVVTLMDGQGHEDINGEISKAASFYPSGIFFDNSGLYVANEYGIRRLK